MDKELELGNMFFGHPSDTRIFGIPRGAGWEDVIMNLFDSYTKLSNYHGEELVTELFEVHPYWWGDCTCGADQKEHEDHDLTCRFYLANFIYKPTGLEIEWYKYPFRDSYMNQCLDLAEFTKIISECIQYVKDHNIGSRNEEG